MAGKHAYPLDETGRAIRPLPPSDCLMPHSGNNRANPAGIMVRHAAMRS
jgi:hypothetical protein